ncbi:hypothetical protein [Candidatus Nanohalovita haloferacivicina]|uniref:hypothetical protein n=1 Tax=Candidatus Nanohalovita haloferacivicina TaxID=2978046 RepID=UPI00325FB570|nr:hypothetical protein HBNXNv_0651 [Candidatus Nanohalobia archaeon BNXNv]
MDTEEIHAAVDQTAEEWPGLYTLFQDKGGKAVDILYHADPENYHIPEADEIYSNVEEKGLIPQRMPGGEFENIVNFLSRAEILPTWNSSAPFRILMDEVDETELASAYEHASGELYRLPENSNADPETRSTLPDYLES